MIEDQLLVEIRQRDDTRGKTKYDEYVHPLDLSRAH